MMTRLLTSAFRYPDGVWLNVAALSLVLLGWPLGIALLTFSAWPAVVLGFGLTCLALIWSAYFIHEFAHNAIFKTSEANRRWGTLMTWINGSCIARFEEMRKKHMRHHIERADVMTFDMQAFLRASPPWFRQGVLLLEWLYFPAVEFLMRGFVMAHAWQRGGKARWRLLGILSIRSAGFAVLAAMSPSATLLYFLAYLLFITMLRFADCFQHTYDTYVLQAEVPVPNDKLRDRAYEQANTFSDIVGLQSSWLNMLWLNFGFHNAHHEKPAMPWHRLPSLHRELFEQDNRQVITVMQLLKAFHIHRVRRVLAADYGVVLPAGERGRAHGFIGAVGVSFLTAV